MSKPIKSVVDRIAIHADADGNLPSEILLLQVGSWHTPYHGDFEHTPEDIVQYVDHFNLGIGLVKEDKVRFPINCGHDRGGPAAAWVYALEARNADTELWATKIEWTDLGVDSVKSGKYAYYSPEWNPRSWPWEDPEVIGRYVVNVITGTALTNIPLFKQQKLNLVMASAITGTSDKRNKGESMTLKLEDVRVKKASDLTEDEKTFLADHKDELTDAERKTFGLEAAAKPQEKPAEKREPKKADAKAGVTIDPERLAQLEADAKAGKEASERLAKKEAEDIVNGHIEAGRIKSDEKDSTVELLLGSAGEQREKLEAHLNALPENPLLKAERGDSGESVVKATDELMRKAADIVKASDGKTPIDAAVKSVLSTDTELRDRVNAEREGKE